MTVSELIERLRQLPPDAVIVEEKDSEFRELNHGDVGFYPDADVTTDDDTRIEGDVVFLTSWS